VPLGSLNIDAYLWTAVSTAGAEEHGRVWSFLLILIRSSLTFDFGEILKLLEASYKIALSYTAGYSCCFLPFSIFLFPLLLLL